MGETCKNTLVPGSLIMRRCECFYCGGKEEGAVLIDWLFGIKVCGVHRPNAERDGAVARYQQRAALLRRTPWVPQGWLRELAAEW